MEKQINVGDAQLVKQYLAGKDSCFQTLMERYKNRVFTTALMIVQDRYIAEDITQETFIKVIKTIRKGKYNEEGKFGPWIARIAHNLAIDHTRKQKKTPTIVTDTGEPVFENLNFTDESYEKDQIGKEDTRMVKDLIKTLPQTQREVLILRHYADMSFKEIADATGVSINTALGRMRYALINLRKEIDKRNAYDQNLYPRRCD